MAHTSNAPRHPTVPRTGIEPTDPPHRGAASRRRGRPAAWCLAIFVIWSSGCVPSREEQLQAVAKDWCLTIRASQVLPVYPLTEDLRPGDIFLVETPLGEQAQAYQSRGFLPLGNQLARLSKPAYPAFYEGEFGISASETRPPSLVWSPAPGGAAPPAGAPALPSAPHAAFPTYSFKVEKGGGLNLGLPIHAIPAALSFLKASSASGTIMISDASTYGVDVASLDAQIRAWADAHRELLNRYVPTAKAQHYLRAVYRVYRAGSVNVTTRNDDQEGAEAAINGAKPISLISQLDNETDPAKYKSLLDNVSTSLSDNLPTGLTPGGSIKVVAASSRSVSMTQPFPAPLIIGYLAVDLPILFDGDLGPASSTLTSLDHPGATAIGDGFTTASAPLAWNTLRIMFAALKADNDQGPRLADQLETAFGAFVAPRVVLFYKDEKGAVKPLPADDSRYQVPANFSSVITLGANIDDSLHFADEGVAALRNAHASEQDIALLSKDLSRLQAAHAYMHSEVLDQNITKRSMYYFTEKILRANQGATK